MGSFRYRKEVEREIASGPAMVAVMQARAKDGEAFAKSIAPVETGAYRDSIQGKVEMTDEGAVAIVEAADPASFYIEVGTEDTPTFAVLQKTLDHLSEG
jgi:hypothetical protein